MVIRPMANSVRVIVQVKDTAEAKKLLEALGETEVHLEIGSHLEVPTMWTAPPVETRIPHVLPGTKKKKHSRKSASARPWTEGEDRLLLQWYLDPANHYTNGGMIQRNLKVFAQSINRTSGATHVRIITRKLNKKLVRGFVDRWPVKLAAKFPTFTTVSVPQSTVVSIFKQLTGKENSKLKYTAGPAIGIETQEQWHKFVYEALSNANAICTALNVKPMLKLGRQGTDLWIQYGGSE